MKKALVIMSVCLIATPLTSEARTHHHKAVYKDAPVMKPVEAQAAPESTTPEWLKNVSGTLAFTTNYMFRGISLTEDNPAVQGGLTYTFPVGIYLNLWGSNANYSAPDGKLVSSEFDTVAGLQGDIIEDLTYNLNLARYNYPGARKANYNEFNSLLTYKILTLGLSYTANYSGTHASGTYYSGALNYAVPSNYILGLEGISVGANTGHYSLAKLAGNSYNDYGVTVNKKISDTYTATVQGTGTNGRAKTPPFDGNQIVGTLTATF